jgi:hypothetical protein
MLIGDRGDGIALKSIEVLGILRTRSKNTLLGA